MTIFLELSENVIKTININVKQYQTNVFYILTNYLGFYESYTNSKVLHNTNVSITSNSNNLIS